MLNWLYIWNSIQFWLVRKGEVLMYHKWKICNTSANYLRTLIGLKTIQENRSQSDESCFYSNILAEIRERMVGIFSNNDLDLRGKQLINYSETQTIKITYFLTGWGENEVWRGECRQRNQGKRARDKDTKDKAKSGDDYEPENLRVMIVSLDRL